MLLTRQDSNLYRKIQSLPCCRYITSYSCRFNRISSLHFYCFEAVLVNASHFEPYPRGEIFYIHEFLFNKWLSHELNLACYPLHHKPNLCTTLDYSSISIVLRNREYLVFRTKTELGLNQRSLPFGLVVHCTGREIRTLKTLFLRQERMPIPPFLHS